MNEIIINKNDELVMKLLHFFITEEGYSPIVLRGAKDEIWLENLDENYKIVRIVSNYIHNNEQLEYDVFRAKHITKQIQAKTLSMHMDVLNIFINLGETVDADKYMHISNIHSIDIKNIKDLKKYEFVTTEFPSITKNTRFKEKGAELFMKITQDITKKNAEESVKAEEVFRTKKPIITYILIALNIIYFILMYIFGNGSTDAITLYKFGAIYPDIATSFEWYRLFTSVFIHIGIIHLICNMYSLYIIGSQLESFFVFTKYLIIYIVSGVIGNLFSVLFTNGISAGASGAIFGLFGALLYFGYHYRLYLGTVIKSQIIPLILLNLFVGFISPGIDNAAHIGGLIGGVLITSALGVKYKSTKFDKINSWIVLGILVIFLVFLILR